MDTTTPKCGHELPTDYIDGQPVPPPIPSDCREDRQDSGYSSKLTISRLNHALYVAYREQVKLENTLANYKLSYIVLGIIGCVLYVWAILASN